MATAVSSVARQEAERQKELKAFIARRHPVYEAMQAHWCFLQETYEGGRCWFDGNIFKYHKEGPKEYESRVTRAYRFNHTREVVDLVNKYLFKVPVQRDRSRAPEAVKQFWNSATLKGLCIDDYAKQVSTRGATCGRVWLVVDSNKTGEVRTRADEKTAKVRIYSYIVLPQFVLDMSYDDRGELNWILIQESKRDDADPIKSSGAVLPRYRLWTRNESQLFEVELDAQNNVKRVIVNDPVQHGLGEVPVFPHDDVLTDDPYTSPAMIADAAYLDRAVANYLSNMDAIIQDQTFSQLAIPAQGLLPGTDEDNTKLDKMVEMGTKRIFTYNGEGNAKPEYLSPDVKQAQLILQVINKIIAEIYHSIGLAGERTKDDNSQGIDNSSGVAKAYDFERVNALLSAKGDSMERTENRLCELVALWAGQQMPKPAADEDDDGLVEYADNFDVRGLYDEFEIAARLSLIEAPDALRQEQMKTLVDKLFPQLKEELKNAMLDEIKSWPPKLDPLTGMTHGTGGQADPISKAGRNRLANSLTKTV